MTATLRPYTRMLFGGLVLMVLIGGSYLLTAGQGLTLAGLGFGEGAAPINDRPSADTAIAFWQGRVAANPSAYIDYTLLGEALVRKARESGDVTYYDRAGESFRRALTISPRYLNATIALAGVHYVTHDFQAALDLAEPLRADPRARLALATISDAYIALGDYTQGEAALNELAVAGESAALLSRQALLAELRGNSAGALQLMTRAGELAQQAGEYPESLAWYALQRGEIAFRSGQIAEAERAYTESLALFSPYPPALAGLGKVASATGGLDDAIQYYEQAVAIVPLPEFLAALGDLYTLTGRPEEARRQYATVERIGTLAALNRQVYNRQLAMFYADRDLKLDEALRLAMAELEQRKDIYGYDAAAWASYKAGRLDQAADLIARALGLGTRDPKLLYHAGMIAAAQGDADEARRLLTEALTINPGFDLLQARVARQTLGE